MLETSNMRALCNLQRCCKSKFSIYCMLEDGGRQIMGRTCDFFSLVLLGGGELLGMLGENVVKCVSW